MTFQAGTKTDYPLRSLYYTLINKRSILRGVKMGYENLIWKEESRRTVYSCPVFSVEERASRSPDNRVKVYTVLDTRDWAIVIPVLETGRGREFVMVRQWRHGAQSLSLEFPGGVFEKDEEPSGAA
jgi:hypothetical protein